MADKPPPDITPEVLEAVIKASKDWEAAKGAISRPLTGIDPEVLQALVRNLNEIRHAQAALAGGIPPSFPPTLGAGFGRLTENYPEPTSDVLRDEYPFVQKLGADEREIVKKWIANHWREPVICPISKDDKWVLLDEIVQAPLATAVLPPTVKHRVYPFIAMMCEGCGYTMLVNAVKVGVVSHNG
jgi:hypothetical protein